MALPKRSLTPENTAEPVIPEETLATSQRLRDLNFKVPHDFKKRFALRAVEDDCTQVELLRRALAAYEAQHGAA